MNEGATSAQEGLVLTRESIEGPYYIETWIHRSNIAEGRPGVPLDLHIQVTDAAGGTLAGALLDIWHCDARGAYSGYESAIASLMLDPPAPEDLGGPAPHQEPDSTTRYLRGFQITDKDGWGKFRTVVPGWYPARTVHIHVKVYVDGIMSAENYIGGRICHTGQLYFPESFLQKLAKISPYSLSEVARTPNPVDAYFTGDSSSDGMLQLSHYGDSLGDGVQGVIRLSLATAAVNLG